MHRVVNDTVFRSNKPCLLQHAALVSANLFFGIGAVIGALGLPATHPLVFAWVREMGAGLILLAISARLYPNDDSSSPAEVSPSSMTIPYVLRAWKAHWKPLAWLGWVVWVLEVG